VTKAHRFNPSSTAEQSNHRVLGISRHDCHVVGQRNIGLGGRVVKDQPRQGTSAARGGKDTLDIRKWSVWWDITYQSLCNGTERRRKLETKHGSKAEMNLHGQTLERVH
jgi:hypothetical protein